MDLIEDIYSNDVYYPFLLYCKSHRYRNMGDLLSCSFEELGKSPNITPILLIRIKGLFTTYCKKHPDVLISRPVRKARPAAPAKPPALEEPLLAYFKEHTECLVRAADAAKAIGAKKSDVIKLLNTAEWCKAVDTSTYFYTPLE